MSTSEGSDRSGPEYRPVRGRKMSRRRSEAAKRQKRKPFQPDFHGLEPRMMMAVFTVTDTSDSASDTGSLRYAITQSNLSGPGPNTIDFNIPTSDPDYDSATGVWTIGTASALPSIVVPVDIDGTSQPGYTNAPRIDLDGTNSGSNVTGLTLATGSDGSTIAALVIDNFTGNGITIRTTDNAIESSFIGVDATGALAQANSGGLEIDASGNTIGGLTSTPGTGAGNVISGNTGDGVEITGSGTTGNLVAGNLIGTDVTGTVALGNLVDGVEIDNSASGNLIGGTTAGARNIIAGNAGAGVFLNDTTDNLVEGDYIGTDVTGTVALPNNYSGPDQTSFSGGVKLYNGSAGNTIGGLTAIPGTGAGNVISGNGSSGVDLEYAGSGNLIAGNLIGTNSTGTTALGNTLPLPLGNLFAGTGVRDDYSPGTTIGELGGSNVISGNGAGTANATNIYMIGSGGSVIQSDFIGVDITGTMSLSESTNVGIYLQDGSYTVGGLTSTPGTGLGNLISGNAEFGIRYDYYTAPDSLLIEGNNIGADATGEIGLPDGLAGINLAQASLVTIGGTAAGARNLITGGRLGGFEGDISLSGSSDNVIQGNYVGTDITGMRSLYLAGNGGSGVLLDAASADNLVGGTSAAARNIIAGSDDPGVYISDTGSSGNLIEGNFIGTDVSGTAAIGNTGAGVEIGSGASGNTIGGTTAGARNIISGNEGAGVFLNDTTDNLVDGDYIGTDLTGMIALANNSGPDQTPYSGGVLIGGGSAGNTIGGLTAIAGTGAGNVISGNGSSGVALEYAGSGNLIVGNLIGTDATGTVALSNTLPLPAGNVLAGTGVRDDYSPGTTIGEIGGSNVISGNGAGTDNASNIYMIGSGGSVIESNFIGTDITGTVSLSASTFYGLYLQDGAYLVGGLTSTPGAGPGNVISGNGICGIHYDDDTAPETLLVEGNIIGADATGEHELPNLDGGISLFQASLVTIGGTASGAGNLITGNYLPGNAGNIDLDDSSNNLIEGNFIGTDISGTTSLAHQPGDTAGNGVSIRDGSTGNVVGGTTAAGPEHHCGIQRRRRLHHRFGHVRKPRRRQLHRDERLRHRRHPEQRRGRRYLFGRLRKHHRRPDNHARLGRGQRDLGQQRRRRRD